MKCKQCGQLVANSSEYCQACGYPANVDALSQQEKDFDLIPQGLSKGNNPYQSPDSMDSNGLESSQTYQLWNPNAAAMWAILFSPLFSAYLHMKNWQALGHLEEAKISKLWVIGVGVFCVVLFFLPDDIPIPRMTVLILVAVDQDRAHVD